MLLLLMVVVVLMFGRRVVVVGILERGIDTEFFLGGRDGDAGGLSLFAHGTVALAVTSTVAVSAGSVNSSGHFSFHLLGLPQWYTLSISLLYGIDDG